MQYHCSMEHMLSSNGSRIKSRLETRLSMTHSSTAPQANTQNTYWKNAPSIKTLLVILFLRSGVCFKHLWLEDMENAQKKNLCNVCTGVCYCADLPAVFQMGSSSVPSGGKTMYWRHWKSAKTFFFNVVDLSKWKKNLLLFFLRDLPRENPGTQRTCKLYIGGPGPELNPAPLHSEADMLTTVPQRVIPPN